MRGKLKAQIIDAIDDNDATQRRKGDSFIPKGS